MQQYLTVRNALEVLGEASQRPGSCSNWDRPETDEAEAVQTVKADDSGAGSNAGPILFGAEEIAPGRRELTESKSGLILA